MIAWNFQRIVGTCQFRVPWFGYPCGYSSLTAKEKQGIGVWVKVVAVPHDSHESIKTLSHISAAGDYKNLGNTGQIA